MSLKPVDLTGGKSVYCFNQSQLDGAFKLYEEEGEQGDAIRAKVKEIEENFTRNDQATIAFVIIDHLNRSSKF